MNTAFVLRMAALIVATWGFDAIAADKPAAERPAPRISVVPAPPDGGPSPALRAAHEALRTGDLARAEDLYAALGSNDGRDVDVLLGQAAVALHRGDAEAARTRYMAVLRLEPGNATAQGALLALYGHADHASAESRLKALAAREPSSFLYQALGNVYAEQGQWPQAQHAYFQAFRLDPLGAAHAYNLAVSLDHIGQRAPARSYYLRAIELARARDTAGFDVRLAQQRADLLRAAAGE